MTDSTGASPPTHARHHHMLPSALGSSHVQLAAAQSDRQMTVVVAVICVATL